MRLWSLIAVLSCAFTLTLALPSRRADHVVHEKRAFDPVEDWVRTRKLEADKVLPMRFGLTQQNLHRIEEMLMSVSHPSSPSYGKHFTPEEVVDTLLRTRKPLRLLSNGFTTLGFTKTDTVFR